MAITVPKQFDSVVKWAKANTVTVVFCALVVLVPVGAFFAADAMGAGVRKEAQRRAQVYNDLTTASNAKVSLPIPGGEPVTLETIATDKIVEQFGAVLEKHSADAVAVYTKAREFNNGTSAEPKHRPVVEAAIFPRYNAASNSTVEQVRFKVADAIAAAYAKLLEDARAGSPPADTKVAKAVEAAELRFIQGDLKQESRAKLTAEQTTLLDRHLGKIRIAEYTEAAKKISIYADLGAFEVPSRGSVTGLYKSKKDADAQDAALFDMQWKLWVASDVMRAFGSANSQAGSVLQSPVKRLLSLKVMPMEKGTVAQSESSGGEATQMGGDAPPAEGSTDGSAPADGSAAAPAAAANTFTEPAIDPKQQAPRDFSKRFTGRISNGVYDVRLAQVEFIAETSKLPMIFDALAAENFMTVTNVRLSPADPFAAARLGFLYGPEPVSVVTATVESLWFRDWTARHMPMSVRTALGIQGAAPLGDAAGTGAQGM